MTAADPAFATGHPELDAAIPLAVAVCERNLVSDGFTAGQRYPRPWLRDTYEGGLFDRRLAPALWDAYVAELDRWAARQGGAPVYVWPPDHPHHVAGGDRCDPGQICTNRSSGDVDETLMFIIAVAGVIDACAQGPVLGRDARTWATRLGPAAAAAWDWAHQQTAGDGVLLGTHPLVAADWADQIGRRGVATNIQALWADATFGLWTIAEQLPDPHAAVGMPEMAETIVAEIRDTLWCEAAPMHLNAPAVAPFGHFAAWIGDDGAVVDYFELDSNFRLLAGRVPTAAQAAAIIGFVRAHPDLLGNGGGPPAAKVLYGDYAPEHYATIHDNSGDGRYHNAWWGHVGALVAEGLHAWGEHTLALDCLHSIAAALQRGAADGTGLREWYAADGTGHGSEWFQWSARAFLRAVGRVCLPDQGGGPVV